MTSVVVGTAGHVDHGKSSLITALTGTNPDRLPDERLRAMTLDIGFATLPLSDGDHIDFIDVPGHADYLQNMIVGSSQADAFLLVVDSSEGIRAQTIEHLDVLQALGLDDGIVAISKVDRAEAQRVELVADHVTRLLRQRFDREIAVVGVSAATGSGLPDLVGALAGLASRISRDAACTASRTTGYPLILVDRVFSVPGRGVVATGTLRGGKLARGQTLNVEPGEHVVRVAEVQRHGVPIRIGVGSTRVAVRLRGLPRMRLARGAVITAPDAVWSGEDALILTDARGQPLRPPMTVVVHSGTDRVEATVRRVWDGINARAVRLRLARATAFRPGAPLVILSSSKSRNVRGARLVDAKTGPSPSWPKTLDPDNLLALLATGPNGHASALVEIRGALGPRLLKQLRESHRALDIHPSSNRSISAGPLWLDRRLYSTLKSVADGHVRGSGGSGCPVSALQSRLATQIRLSGGTALTDAKAAAEILIGQWANAGSLVRSGDWLVSPDEAARTDVAARLFRVLSGPKPPAVKVALESTGCSFGDLLGLEQRGMLVRLTAEIAISNAEYDRWIEAARHLAASGPVTPAGLRDALGGRRGAAIAFLEHMNEVGLFVRTDAGHVLAEEPHRSVGAN